MNDPDPRDLGHLLELACDRIEPPTYVSGVLTRARRRRARRTALGAAAAAAVVVVGVAAVPPPTRAPSDLRPPASSGAAAPTGSTTTPPGAAGGRSPAPVLDPAVVQPRWDPREVDSLPQAGVDLRGQLPDVADVPTGDVARLTDDPIGVAVAVVPDLDGRAALLLGTSGEWRTVDLLGVYSQTALSPRGDRLVVRADDGTLAVDDLVTGERRTLPRPAGSSPTDIARVAWLDEERILVADGAGGRVVDADSGQSQPVLFPSGSRNDSRWAVDGAGQVVEVADAGGSQAMVDWSGGDRRVVPGAVAGDLTAIAASGGVVAGTALRLTADDTVDGSSTAGYAVVTVDRGTGSPTAALPVLDVEGNYSGGGLSVVGLREDGLVLLRLSLLPGRGEQLVAWDPGSGQLSRVARFDVDQRQVGFARDLLTGGGS